MRLSFYASVVAIGFSSMIAQLTLLREFLGVFYGNELVFGVILGNWMLLVAAGSVFGRRAGGISDKMRVFAITLFAAGLLLPASVFFARVGVIYFVNPGEMAGLGGIFAVTSAVMCLYCVLYGFQVVLACSILSDEEKSMGVGKAYLLDTLGCIVGGVLFSFALTYHLNSTQVSYFAAAILILSSIALAYNLGRRPLALAGCAILALAAVSYPILDLQKLGNTLRYPGQEVVFQKDTPYGNIIVTEAEGQVNFIENGMPLFSTQDTARREEAVHYAMPQAGRTDYVLLIGGGVSGTVDEILKYNPKRVDYVELDSAMVDAGLGFVRSDALKDPRVSVINEDGRLYVKKTAQRYDVILIDLPGPMTTQLNRYYTLEFFREAKKALNPGGVISLSISSTENYMNPETRRLNAAVYQTLKAVFRNVLVVPGGANHFVASEAGLSYDIQTLLSFKKIKTEYVNEGYLRGMLTSDRIAYVQKAVNMSADLNKDLRPVGYFYHMSYWLKQFHGDPVWLLAALFMGLFFVYFRLKPLEAGVFTVGFAATSIEVVVLSSFQAVYGFVYGEVGAIVTFFMVGLAFGAYYGNGMGGQNGLKNIRLIPFSTAVLCILIAGILSIFPQAPPDLPVSALGKAIFPILTLLAGFHVGVLFPLASKSRIIAGADASHAAGSLYAVDLAGAFFGALLSSTLFMPFYGVVAVCFLTATVNLISALRLS